MTKAILKKLADSIDTKPYIWLLSFLALTCFAYFGFGQNSVIKVFDTFDSHVIRNFHDGRLFNEYGITNWYNLEACGTDKTVNDISYTYSSQFLLWFFHNQVGYVLAIVLQCTVLAFSVFLLARKTINCSNAAALAAAIITIAYLSCKDLKLSNIYYNSSLALLPLVILFLKYLSTKAKINIKDIVLLILFAFGFGLTNTVFVSTPFACIVCVLYFIFMGGINRKLILLTAIFWAITILPCIDNLLILAKLGPISHRTAWDIEKLIKYAININITKGFYVIIAIMLIGFSFKKVSSEQLKLFGLFFVCNKVIPIIAIWHTRLAAEYNLPNVNIARVKWFCCIWAGLLCASFLKTLAKQQVAKKAGITTCVAIIILILICPATYAWQISRHAGLFDTYKNYTSFAPDDIIRNHHNSNEPFRVACISDKPTYCYRLAINEIETLGGYINCYSLRYYYYWLNMIEPLKGTDSQYYEMFPSSARQLNLTYNPQATDQLPSWHYDTEMVSLANAKYIWSQKPLTYPGYECIFENPEPDIPQNGLAYYKAITKNIPVDGFGYVYFNHNYLPRAFTVNNFENCDNLADLYKKLSSLSIDQIKEMVLLEKDYSSEIPLLTATHSHCNITSYTPDKITVQTQADGHAILVISNNYNPFWHCYIDGKEAKLLPGFGAFWAVPITPGQHNIEFIYSYSNN
ncbi:MAG: YfhO family protein [Phycisphaerae bacterium]|nr:YfhO family protein [Phycisphaerae bacterium]